MWLARIFLSARATPSSVKLSSAFRGAYMSTIRDWQQNRAMWVRVLEKQTNQKLDYWNRLVRETAITDENDLRMWLTARGVTGYAQTLLVMERFGFPDFITATADELIARQYAGRSHLRAVYDAIIDAAITLFPYTTLFRSNRKSVV